VQNLRDVTPLLSAAFFGQAPAMEVLLQRCGSLTRREQLPAFLALCLRPACCISKRCLMGVCRSYSRLL